MLRTLRSRCIAVIALVLVVGSTGWWTASTMLRDNAHGATADSMHVHWDDPG